MDICLPEDALTLRSRLNKALEIVERYGSFDGGHHKMWVIDQIARILTGPEYDAWVKQVCDGEDGPETYEWDKGVPP